MDMACSNSANLSGRKCPVPFPKIERMEGKAMVSLCPMFGLILSESLSPVSHPYLIRAEADGFCFAKRGLTPLSLPRKLRSLRPTGRNLKTLAAYRRYLRHTARMAI